MCSDPITIKFDAPPSNETKDTQEFFGALDAETGNLTSSGIYKSKSDPSEYKTCHLT